MNFKIWIKFWMTILLVLGFAVYEKTVSANSDWDQSQATESVGAIRSTDYRQVKCMATAIYYESAHEPRLGQIAVAKVIQNRVRAGFAATPCEVVYQKTDGVCQFSWSCERRPAVNAAKCRECWTIATQVLAQNQYQDYMKTALYFHATSSNPGWRNLRPIRVIGNHKFYRKG